MKLGLGSMVLGFVAVAAAHGCGGGAAPGIDMCLVDGRWTGQGGCGVPSFGLSTANGVTLTDFGANPSVTFAPDSARTKLTATGLEILLAPDYACTLTCKSDGSLALHCASSQGGKCDSTFTFDLAPLRAG